MKELRYGASNRDDVKIPAVVDATCPMSQGAPGATFDPLSEDIRRCPHAYYPALHAAGSCPVVPVQGEENFFLVVGYDVVQRVLMDPETFDGQVFPEVSVPILSALPPESHRRVRGAVGSMFTPRALAKLEPVIEQVVTEATDSLVARGGGDLMTVWANRIPLYVIARMFGLDETERGLERLHFWGDSIVKLGIPLGGPGPRDAHLGLRGRLRLAWHGLSLLWHAAGIARVLGVREVRSLLAIRPPAPRPGIPRSNLPLHPELVATPFAFLHELARVIERHRREPKDQVVDLLVEAHLAGNISMLEVLFAGIQILVAGYETTASSLGSAVAYLARNPKTADALREDPSLIDPFIEEVLRLYAPLQRTLRRTTRPVELGGVSLPKDAQLIVFLGAANTDPEQFARPYEFDLGRARLRTHMAFGKGIHHCLGATLNRIESRIALRTFLAKVDRVAFVPDDPPVPVTRKDVGMLGFVNLPVRVSPRRACVEPR